MISPAPQTGATSKSSRGGSRLIVAAALPVPVVGKLADPIRHDCDGDQEDQYPCLPLKHRTPFPRGRTARFSALAGAMPSPVRGVSAFALRKSGEVRFSEGATAPGEAVGVPVLHARERDAVTRRIDQPAPAEVDPGMVDRGGSGATAAATEEHDVAGLEFCERDATRAWDLARHLRRCPAAQRLGKRFGARITVELEDLPDEARAVEAATCCDPKERSRYGARSAPDVGVADQVDASLDDLPLPRGVFGQLELRGCLLDGRGLPLAEPKDLRRRVSGLGPSCVVPREQLEVVVRHFVVLAQTAQPSDHLAAEAGGRTKTGGASPQVEEARVVVEVEGADER